MRTAILIVVSLILASCAPVQTGPSGRKTVVTGAAGGGTTQTVGTSFERCTESFGTLALLEEEDEDWYYVIIHEYRLPPASKLLRLLVQQSNCFVVVERDRQGMRTNEKERALQLASAEMQQGSSFGKGQMVPADYTLTPSVTFSSNDPVSIGAAVGTLPRSLEDSAGKAVGTVGGVKKREASTMLTLVENRTGVQIAAAEGNAARFDFGLLGRIFSGSGGVGLGGYEKTPEGNILAAAFADSFNQMVQALKNYRAQEVKGGLGKGGTLKVGN